MFEIVPQGQEVMYQRFVPRLRVNTNGVQLFNVASTTKNVLKFLANGDYCMTQADCATFASYYIHNLSLKLNIDDATSDQIVCVTEGSSGRSERVSRRNPSIGRGTGAAARFALQLS